jgi:flagellar basal-body rod protein FlgG
MTSQQMQVDTIANNLANVNTNGFKRENIEFKSLLYQTMRRTDLDPANQTGRPVNLQVGLGVRPAATNRDYSNGNLQVTNQPLDFAMMGEGFFVVRRSADEEPVYTRAGAFKVSVTFDGNMITTADGFPLLSTDGDTIIIPPDVQISALLVNDFGEISYQDHEMGTVDLGIQVAIVQFANPQGLEAIGSNLLRTTAASGDPLSEADGQTNSRTYLVQGALEMSNVQVANEMVSLIVTQRAYELNARVITTSDEMLQQAAGLKR